MLPWKIASSPIPNGTPASMGIQTLKWAGDVQASQNKPIGNSAAADMTAVSTRSGWIDSVRLTRHKTLFGLDLAVVDPSTLDSLLRVGGETLVPYVVGERADEQEEEAHKDG